MRVVMNKKLIILKFIPNYILIIDNFIKFCSDEQEQAFAHRTLCTKYWLFHCFPNTKLFFKITRTNQLVVQKTV
jgi:hypothetical protein